MRLNKNNFVISKKKILKSYTKLRIILYHDYDKHINYFLIYFLNWHTMQFFIYK